MNAQVENSLNQLIGSMKEAEEYVRLKEIASRVEKDETIKNMVARTQQIRNELSDIPERDKNSDYAETLEQEYEELCENTLVYDFVCAEMEFCAMFQEMLARIVESV